MALCIRRAVFFGLLSGNLKNYLFIVFIPYLKLRISATDAWILLSFASVSPPMPMHADGFLR
jgi:hypothetical protein